MSHYCGIDLHSNNHVAVVIDEEDKRVLEKRLNKDLSLTLRVLSPKQVDRASVNQWPRAAMFAVTPAA